MTALTWRTDVWATALLAAAMLTPDAPELAAEPEWCRAEYRPGHRDGWCGFPLAHPPIAHGDTFYRHGNEHTGWWWNDLLPASCGDPVNHPPHVTDLGKWCDGQVAW